MLFNSNPFAVLGRILRDFPWLWAIKQDWCHTDLVKVYPVDSLDKLDWTITSQPDVSKSCYIYTENLAGEPCLHEVEVFSPGTIFDALDNFWNSGYRLWAVKALAVRVGVCGEIRIFRPKKRITWESLYTQHPRAGYRAE